MLLGIKDGKNKSWAGIHNLSFTKGTFLSLLPTVSIILNLSCGQWRNVQGRSLIFLTLCIRMKSHWAAPGPGMSPKKQSGQGCISQPGAGNAIKTHRTDFIRSTVLGTCGNYQAPEHFRHQIKYQFCTAAVGGVFHLPWLLSFSSSIFCLQH